MSQFSQTGFSKNSRLLLVMVAVFGLGAGAYWVLLNLYFKEIGFSEGFIGQVTGLVAVGSILATIPMAWLCGQMKIKWVIIGSVILNVFGDGLLVLSSSPEWIQWGALISGMGFISWMTATAPFIMRNSTGEQRGQLFSYKHGVGLVASGVASIGFAALVESFSSGEMSLKSSYMVVLGVASGFKLIAALLGLFVTPQNPLPEEKRDLKEFFVGKDWTAIFKISSPMMLIGFGAGMTMPFMNLYFRQRFNIDTGTIGIYFFVCTMFMAMGTLYGPKMAFRRGNIRTVILTQMMSLPFMLVLAFTGNIGLALAAFFARATLMNMGHPLYHHFSMELVEAKEQASANAFIGLAWNIGWFGGSWLGGMSIERHGFTPTILATAFCYALATAVQLKLFSARRLIAIGRSQEASA